MAKKNPEFIIETFGRYQKWNKEERELPRFNEFTEKIEAIVDNEFGMVICIKKGKGITLDFRIEHPPIVDDLGKMLPDFTGQQFVPVNEYRFFIGDCVWEPAAEKCGSWVVSVYYSGKLVAQKKFEVVLPD